MILIIHISFLVFLYGCIWLVPMSINYNRRKAGLSPYWALLLITLVLEIAIVYSVIYFFKELSQSIFIAYLPPLVASVFAGLFYYHMAKKLDDKHS